MASAGTAAHRSPPHRPWAAWHLHLAALGAPAADNVVHHVVGPAVDWCRQRDPMVRWFFVRYWQFGPHIRLRIGELGDDSEHRLDGLLRARLADVADASPGDLTPGEYRRQAAGLAAAGEGGGPLEVGELWPPGVYRQHYRPEVTRYGGAGLMARSEALFQEASELALAFARLGPPEAARAGLGLRATWAALGAVAPDRRFGFTTDAAAGWQAWAARNGLGTVPGPPQVALPDSPAPAPVRRWAEQLVPAMAEWRTMASGTEADRILQAHIHMLHNRLGLSVGQELTNYLALAEALGPAMAVAP